MRVRYRGSYYGFLLSITVPIVQVTVLTVAFKYLVRFNTRDNYSAYLFCGILAYQFLQYVTLESSSCILKHRDLVKKAYFPREALPLGSVLGNLVHYGFTMLLFLGFLAVVGHFPTVDYLWIPVVMLAHTCLALGCALLFSALNTLMHDIEFLLGHLFMLGFYLSPILYESRLVREHAPRAYGLYMANPMATIIETYRAVVLGESLPDAWALVLCAVVCLAVLGIGYGVFRRVAWRLPELI
jgi:ABC-2 type transport system permease protein